jgi:signal transduction histidine kinase
MLQLWGVTDAASILGQRPGETIGCVHSAETEGGCGTAEACAVCGALAAVLECLRSGLKVSREARITTSRLTGELQHLDLLVTATPLHVNGEDFAVVSMTDTSNEKRRLALERIFFHDLLNTAGAVHGLLELLREGGSEDEISELLGIADQSARQLLEQIQSQRTLMLAEAGDLSVDLSRVDALDLLREVAEQYRAHEVGVGREIVVAEGCRTTHLETDRTLLSRVLGNLIKNALEASAAGDRVTIGCSTGDDAVEFSVHNPAVMPRAIQLQVFQRSFSTKGRDRGLGTYSVRLLTERYLRGKATFESADGLGTTFRVRYPLEYPDAQAQG